ncbi:MAG: PD40 domain-containing protein [Deltaproteobacteria bacterium]|nr:PD40 domain-containing protein [Deltaproteobacteria bacterium]
MRMRLACLSLAIAAAACGPTPRGDDVDAPTIRVEPEDLTLEVVNRAVVSQPYTAKLLLPDADPEDITASVTFEVVESAFGTFSGSTLTLGGGASGRARVVARHDGLSGDTGLTVLVKDRRFDGNVPPNAPDLFGSAVETAGLAPQIAYPAHDITVPPNLGEFDVHWRSSPADLYEIALQNQFVDVRIYKAATGNAFVTYTPDEWYTLGSSSEPLTLTVAGMRTTQPDQKGTAQPQNVNVTNETVVGGMYYWTTAPSQGVYRYDMGLPNVPPSSYFPMNAEPTPCLGCHGLSKDGTKMALTLDSGDGRGTIFEVADRSVLVPYTTNAQNWNFASFTPDATKLVTVFQGNMVFRATAGGGVLANIPSNPGLRATHPELSPDGTRLANVETSQLSWDFQVFNGSIVVRTVDASTNTFGPIQTLVPNQSGASNYYPSWSPDGQWIAFTRTTGNSYADTSAQAWIVKADGSLPPIQLNIANLGPNLTNSWPRWTPFAQSTGPNREPLFFLTFSTMRAFGVRPTGGTQIWMTPFFPDRAIAGQDPSGPAFRMPFQLTSSANHIAQWTQAIVIGRKADGSILTASEAGTYDLAP